MGMSINSSSLSLSSLLRFRSLVEGLMPSVSLKAASSSAHTWSEITPLLCTTSLLSDHNIWASLTCHCATPLTCCVRSLVALQKLGYIANGHRRIWYRLDKIDAYPIPRMKLSHELYRHNTSEIQRNCRCMCRHPVSSLISTTKFCFRPRESKAMLKILLHCNTLSSSSLRKMKPWSLRKVHGLDPKLRQSKICTTYPIVFQNKSTLDNMFRRKPSCP